MKPTIHYLKIWHNYFDDVHYNVKTFECRKNDRDYKEGDILCLASWHDMAYEYTGLRTYKKVTYILHAYKMFGIEEGYVVMAIRPLTLWERFTELRNR